MSGGRAKQVSQAGLHARLWARLAAIPTESGKDATAVRIATEATKQIPWMATEPRCSIWLKTFARRVGLSQRELHVQLDRLVELGVVVLEGPPDNTVLDFTPLLARSDGAECKEPGC